MRTFAFLTVLGLTAMTTSNALADGFWSPPCKGPYCNHHPGISTLFHHRGQTLPVYQAAPWYLYWPYDAHFMTPAPVFGAYYPPPMNNYPVQPFFPAQNYGFYGPSMGGYSVPAGTQGGVLNSTPAPNPNPLPKMP